MTTPQDPGSGLIATFEPLNESACWGILARGQVGRLGLVVDGRPQVLPVNYALDGETVLFRTAEGTVLDGVADRPVAFELDGVDETIHEGWSVLVQGTARYLGEHVDARSDRIRVLSLITWAPGNRSRWFRIEPDQVTGRRVRVLPDSL